MSLSILRSLARMTLAAAFVALSACGGGGSDTPPDADGSSDEPGLPIPAQGSVSAAPYHASDGYGTETNGGLGGRVIPVTSLAPTGEGSLRAAVEASGERLIVFEVGGVIDLAGQTLTVREPNVTIAGQTAPDPGMTLIRGSLVVSTHDVVVQHIASRPGDAGRASGETWEPDAMVVNGSSSHPAYRVVFDHCSATWGIDENLSVSGPADVTVGNDPHVTSHDVTLYRCLIAEGLSFATHSKGEHSKGSLIHDSVYNVSVIGCLFAHNRERNPRLKGATRTVVVNNLIYNWGAQCIGVGTKGNDVYLTAARSAIVGNVAVEGGDTASSVFVENLDTGADVYLLDNLARGRSGADIELSNRGVNLLTRPPLWPAALRYAAVRDAARATLRMAGARPARRDPIDSRIVASVIQGTGGMINSQNSVGGYPVRAEQRRALTVPEGADSRRQWLDALSAELDEAQGLDTTPFETVLR